MRGEHVDLTQELHGAEMAPGGLFVSRALRAGLRAIKTGSWPTSASELPDIGEAVLRVTGEQRENVLLERDGGLVQLSLVPGRVFAAVANRDEAVADSMLAWLRDQFPAPDRSASHDVRVTFWTYGQHGPHPIWRSIAVPGWDEIRENYSAPTREKLEPLMVGFEPARGGQLVLWHGQTGTGKTYALRALAWEWRRWCDFHYIVDPDSFFGQHADYLLNVLLQPTDPDLELDEEFDVEIADVATEIGVGGAARFGSWTSYGPIPDARSKPWKLLMLEDAGELLTADARAVIGQGLSRFLNVVDGLIGQGLRVLVLVTTNEAIRTLHPAVARPGRAAANVEFVPLTADEASAWLERHEVTGRGSGPTTLAALYAQAAGLDPADARAQPGFGG
jgi:hypothetical protein